MNSFVRLFPKFRSQSRPSLSLILKVTYTSQIVLAVGLTGWFSLRNGCIAVHQLALELREQTASQVSQYIQRQLETAQQINQMNIAAIEIGMLPLNDFELMGQFFWQQMQIYDVSYLNFANEQGEFIGVERTGDNQFLINETRAPDLTQMHIFETDHQGNRLQSVITSAPKPVTKEGWYADAVTAGNPVWSDIYPWDDQPDILSISASYPLYDTQQQLIGVIGADLVVSHMSQFLRTLTQDQSGTIFVIERNGALVASSSIYASYRIEAGEAQRLTALESPDPIIQATAQQIQDQILTGAQIPKDSSVVFKLEGVRHYVNVNVYQDNMGLDWLIVTVVPETEFIGQINRNTRITILMCLLAAAIAVLSCLITSRWINRPIQNLVAASQEVSKGNLNQSLKSHFIQEFEGLNRAFNAMADQLRSAFAEMENRVAQRTAELATAKKQAELANQSKTRFLTNVSHELRAPLNVILGFTQLILNDDQLSLEYQDAIWRIRQNGQSLLALMNAILQVTRLEEEVGIYDVCFNLHKFLDAQYRKLQPIAAAKKLNLTMTSLAELPQFIYADELKLGEVLNNLVSNAIACLQQGQIIIRVSAKSSGSANDCSETGRDQQFWCLQFDIEHSGIGTSILSHAESSQAFTQVPLECNLNQGSELGLYISREYVRLMGGKLTYKTTSNQKTVFRFSIPVRVIASLNEIPKPVHPTLKHPTLGTERELTDDEEKLISISYALSKMPSDWLEQIEQAALKGSDSSLEQLIESIPIEYSELASFLRTETLNFNFDSILKLLNITHHEATL